VRNYGLFILLSVRA